MPLIKVGYEKQMIPSTFPCIIPAAPGGEKGLETGTQLGHLNAKTHSV